MTLQEKSDRALVISVLTGVVLLAVAAFESRAAWLLPIWVVVCGSYVRSFKCPSCGRGIWTAPGQKLSFRGSFRIPETCNWCRRGMAVEKQHPRLHK